MKSYLISAFVRTHAHLDEESFRLSEPTAWLVWEAGPWKPGGARTLTAAPPAPLANPVSAAAEALAYSLAPRETTKDQVTLGRNPVCDIVINDGTVSMLHLVFLRSETGWLVQDSGSRNGSSLSGAPLESGKPKALISTARLMAGSVAFSFYEPKDMLWRLKQYR
ncbi:MAG: FHA domain-containing protein [Archangium sp.]|nr:FHA domain-containing protein [Archangium sp.]MDP3574981.1 FHA domain-containing protein [Archangium sp.]